MPTNKPKRSSAITQKQSNEKSFSYFFSSFFRGDGHMLKRDDEQAIVMT